MAAFRIFRRFRQLQDVDDTGLAQGDVPTYETAVSKFTMAPPAGAQSAHSVTLSGNTAGALALISTGTWTLAGGQNITLSQAGNAVTISGGAGSAAETQTAISGISASNTLYTSGTVRLTGVGGGVTVGSNTGQRVDISVAAPVAQSVQTQNVVDLTLSGNTAGALALVSSGTVTLAGGANVTLSQAGNAVTISAGGGAETQTFIAGVSASNTLYTSGNVRISGSQAATVRSGTGQLVIIDVPTQSVQPETQTFVGGVSASDALYTSGTVRVTGVGGGITVSSNTGQRIDLSVAAPVAQTVQTQNVVDLTLSGNTAGALALVSSGTATLAGGNNITLSQAGNAITISGPNVAGAQTGISSIANSETTYTAGAVTLSELGAITIRSTTGSQFQFSVNPQSVQPETQTFIAGVSASNTLYTSGNVRITGVGGGITVSSNTGQRIDLSVAAQSVQPETQTFVAGVSASDTLYTSGNVRFTGSQAVTVRSGTGQLVVIDVPAQSVQAETQTFIAGVSASDTLYTSGNVRITGVGGGITVSSNTGQRVDLSVAAQTNQAGSVYAISNTSGTSSGTYDARTLSIAGAGIVTVAASNSGWRINASQSVQPETQTFVGGISASDTLYTSGSVRFTGVGGGVTVSSNTGQRVDISVAAPVAATNLSVGVSNAGNTAGDTTVNTGSRLVIVGSNGITASQGTAAGATTVTLSGATQTVQTQGGFASLGVSTGGNTAGNTQVSTGSRFVLVASGNLTASQATAAGASTVTLSVAAQSVQPETQTFIAGVSASDTLYTSGNVRITGVGGGITVSSNTGQRVDLSVAAQSVQTQNLHNVTLSGNSTSAGAGYIQISSGTMTLAGGNNITLSQNGNAVTISGPNVAGAQTGISGIANSETTYTSGTVSLSELGAITIRSTTGNQYQLSVNAQTNQAGNVYASSNTFGTSSGTYDARSISIAGRGAVSVAASNSGWIISAPAQSVQVETQTFIGGISVTDTNYTSGTVRFTGSNMITVKSSGAGQTVILDATQSVQTQDVLSVGASTGGNTAGNTTVNTGSRLVFVGSNNITVSQGTAAGATTLTLSGPATSAQQTGISGIANSQTTYTSGTVSLSELGAITIRSTTGNQYQLSVNSQTAQTQSNIAGLYDGANSISTGTVRLTDANGVTFSINAQTLSASVNQSISMFAVSNTTQSTSGTAHKSALSFGGAGVASVGVTGGSVVVSVPAGGGAGFSAGVSTGGNTAGATGITGTQLVLVGTNNISLSQTTGANGATISISGVDKFSAGISTGGNTAGDTGVTGTRLVFVGDSPISLSQATGAAGGTISIDAPATSSLSGTGGIVFSTNGSTISVGYGANQPDWENFAMGNAALATHVSAISKTPIYWVDNIDGNLTAKSLALKISMVTASQPLSVSVHLGVYTHVNSTSAARLASHSEAFVVSSATSVSLSGVRALILTGIGTHATLSTISGGVYVLGLMFSATATNAMNFSLYGAGSAGGPLGGLYPGTNNVSAGTSQGIQALAGRGSTTVNAMPANIQASEIVNYGQGASMQLHPWVYIRS